MKAPNPESDPMRNRLDRVEHPPLADADVESMYSQITQQEEKNVAATSFHYIVWALVATVLIVAGAIAFRNSVFQADTVDFNGDASVDCVLVATTEDSSGRKVGVVFDTKKNESRLLVVGDSYYGGEVQSISDHNLVLRKNDQDHSIAAGEVKAALPTILFADSVLRTELLSLQASLVQGNLSEEDRVQIWEWAYEGDVGALILLLQTDESLGQERGLMHMAATALDTASPVRESILGQLARIDSPVSFQVIRRIATDKFDTCRITALRLLASQERLEALPVLESALNDSSLSETLRRQLVESVERLRTSKGK